MWSRHRGIKMKKNLLWYKKMGFHNNPFSIKPSAYHNNLFGSESKVKDILKLIKSGKSCFISGEYGSGKTSALKKIIDEYAGKKKLIYLNFNSGSLNAKKLLIGRSGMIKKLLRIKAKNVILLADEVQDMNLKDAKQIKQFQEEGNFKSVVFVGKDVELPEEVKGVIGENVFKFSGLDNKDAIKLTRSRVGKLKILSDDMIKLINKKSNNPRDLLKSLEDVLRFVIDSDEKTVLEKHVKKVLG